jgi:hypothetical protein
VIDWQPIETVPKDGRQVLLHTRNGTIAIASSSVLKEATQAEKIAMYKNDGSLPNAGFLPTHWAFLNPPEET